LSALSVPILAQYTPPASDNTLPGPVTYPASPQVQTLQSPAVLPVAEKTVEQILDEVTQLQIQRDALEKKVQELLAEARKKLQGQIERLKLLGGNRNPDIQVVVPPLGQSSSHDMQQVFEFYLGFSR
jgi:hypothetical protein